MTSSPSTKDETNRAQRISLPGQPTPYPEVNAVLDALLSAIQEVLGERFLGLYIHGSLANGDFIPQRSDIDFLVVTENELPDELLSALTAMHARLASSGLKWATKLEGSYIPRDALHRYDPSRALHPALRVDGTFAVDGHGMDWVIQRHELRESALTLAGPPLAGLIDPVQPQEILQAARGTLFEWWQPMLADPSRLQTGEYRAYAVLTMCRALYTLQHAAVAPKSVAARWAQANLEPRWSGLIERALAWPDGPQPEDLEGTLSFIRYTLDRSRDFRPLGDPV